MLDHLLHGLVAALQLKQFLFIIAGTVIGLWVGVLPGLGGPVAMAILIPFTFSMDPLSALLMLASISVGAAFGGSVTSILLIFRARRRPPPPLMTAIRWRSRARPWPRWGFQPARPWWRGSSAC